MSTNPPRDPALTAELTTAVRLRERGDEESRREAAARLAGLSAELPDDAEVAYQAAWAHDVLGLEAEALPFYQRALGRPDDGGRPPRTAPTALSEADRRGALLGLGSTYRVLGRYPESVAVLREGCAAYPADGALRAFLAMSLFNTGEHEESMRLLLTLLADTSTDAGVRDYRAAIAFYAEDLHATV